MAAPCVNSILQNFRSRFSILCRLTGDWRSTTAPSFRITHRQSSSELSEPSADPERIPNPKDQNHDLSRDELVSDEPVEMQDPYTKPHKKCILCQHGIEPDYKCFDAIVTLRVGLGIRPFSAILLYWLSAHAPQNVQLLSQFVSPFTGRIYGRHITGLCTPMQKRIALLIKRSQKNGFMPYMFKETVYLRDPKLYDPFGRIEQVPEEDK